MIYTELTALHYSYLLEWLRFKASIKLVEVNAGMDIHMDWTVTERWLNLFDKKSPFVLTAHTSFDNPTFEAQGIDAHELSAAIGLIIEAELTANTNNFNVVAGHASIGVDFIKLTYKKNKDNEE